MTNTIEIRFRQIEIDQEDGMLYALSLDGRLYCKYIDSDCEWQLVPGPVVDKIPGMFNEKKFQSINKMSV